MKERSPRKQVVLLGVGHTNAHILRMWRMEAPVDVGLVCVSNFRKATYSGMLPGVLSGQYQPDEMQIDLVRLTAACSARLVIGECTGIDHERRRLLFSDHAPVAFDLLSIGIGSVPSFAGVEIESDRLLAVKPMQTLLGRLKAKLTEWQQTQPTGPLRVAVVGGGAGGIEVSFCLEPFFRQHCPTHELRTTVVQGAEEILPGFKPATAARVRRQFERRGIQCVTGQRVHSLRDRTLTLEDGSTLEADLVIWTASASPPPLLSQLELPLTEPGFIEVRETLQVVGHDRIFSVGDTATLQGKRLPKCGVYAVRQGPVLWRNIKKALVNRPLERFRPQADFLRLLNLGDGSAIGEQWGLSFEGRWAWLWKDRIDRQFMAKYQDYEKPVMGMPLVPEDEAPPMRCAGCGGKVGASVLSAVLSDLDVPQRPEVLVGLD
ncbi:MAG: FAD-dependent oxidoreductase, partial [Planctomycetota bacterium]